MNAIHKIHHELIIAISLSFLSVECSLPYARGPEPIAMSIEPLGISYAIRCGPPVEPISRLNSDCAQALPKMARRSG